MMEKSWTLLLLSLLCVCLCQSGRYNRCGRVYGGQCRKSLQEYPCNDEDSLLTEAIGKPLCPGKKPYCCIPSPGPTCWGYNGIRGHCVNHSNDTWIDAEGALQPAGEGGLHLSFGDWKCSIFNKKTCCTNRLPCGEGAYCGPYKDESDGTSRCVNGQWEASGDHLCPDQTICCRSVSLSDSTFLAPKENV